MRCAAVTSYFGGRQTLFTHQSLSGLPFASASAMNELTCGIKDKKSRCFENMFEAFATKLN